MWIYHVIKLHKTNKTYTIVASKEDKEDAENSLRRFKFSDGFSKYKIIRKSDKNY